MKDIYNNDFKFFKECLHVEVVGKTRDFTWGRVFRRYFKQPKKRYLFWWRLASFLYDKKGLYQKLAEKINNWLMLKYGTEIALGAQIQPGLYIAHYGGIVISRYSIIGRNFTIRQNTTIGLSHGGTKAIAIGDNVDIGCHCCIISNGLIIGDNVTIGAMSFVNRNIPSNNLYYTKKENVISPRFIDSSDIK